MSFLTIEQMLDVSNICTYAYYVLYPLDNSLNRKAMKNNKATFPGRGYEQNHTYKTSLCHPNFHSHRPINAANFPGVIEALKTRRKLLKARTITGILCLFTFRRYPIAEFYIFNTSVRR